jgi:ketosteroid isomerase-like protein
MSQEGMEGIHRFFEAFNRRDQEALLDTQDPAVAFRAFPADEIAVQHGHDGMREWWDTLLTVFPDMQMTPLQVLDFGDDFVVHVRNVGKGAGSGVAVDEPVWTAITVASSKAVRWASFRTEAEALEAIEPSAWRERVRWKRRRRRLRKRQGRSIPT